MKNKNVRRHNYLIKDLSSTYSESFQNLQVNLDFTAIDCEHKIIAISSPSPMEGKTTVVSNLAYVYSKKDLKVLIIDLDLRKPNVHRLFNLSNEVGLTDYCSTKIELDSVIQKYEHLDIICSGSSTLFPGKIIESKKFSDLIEKLKDKYDYIFIDTPPLLAASDALLISKFVTQFVLVVQYGKTKKSSLDEVLRQLKNNKVEVSGVVINKIASPKNKEYRYSYSYRSKSNNQEVK